MKKMMQIDPDKRITAVEALEHPWFKIFESGEEESKISQADREKFQKDVVENLKKYRGMSVLKKAAMNILIKTLPTDEDIQKLNKEFERLDKDRSGCLSSNEMITILKEYDLKISQQDID